VDDGRLRVEIARLFPLEDFAAAYQFARTARRRGKVVIQVAATERQLGEQAAVAVGGGGG
jgi:hypothetical protein